MTYYSSNGGPRIKVDGTIPSNRLFITVLPQKKNTDDFMTPIREALGYVSESKETVYLASAWVVKMDNMTNAIAIRDEYNLKKVKDPGIPGQMYMINFLPSET